MYVETSSPTGDIGSDWRLVSIVERPGLFPDLQVVTCASPDDARRLYDAMSGVRDFEARHYVSLVWRTNHEEWAKYWRQVHTDYGQDRAYNGRVGTRVSLELKRLLLNYLSSSVSMVAHSRRRLKRDDKERRDSAGWHEYERWRKEAEHSFDYVFLIALRNYFQHAGLPAFALSFHSGFTTGNGPGSFTIPRLTVDRDTLLKEPREWQALDRYRRQLPSAIDIPTIVDRFTRRLHDLANICVEASVRIVRADWIYARDRWDEAKAHASQGTPALARYEQRTSGAWMLALHQFPEDAMGLASMLFRIHKTGPDDHR